MSSVDVKLELSKKRGFEAMARYPTEHAGHVYDPYRLCIFRSEGAQSVVEHHAPDQWRRLYGSALLDTGEAVDLPERSH